MLNIPPGKPRSGAAILGSKIPTPEEIVMLPQPVLKAVIKLGDELREINSNWAVGGDAGEVMKGVNLLAEFIEILTTKDGTAEIWASMSGYQTLAPAAVERKLERPAEVDGKMLPIIVRSHYAELTVDGVKVKVNGDQQIKVGEWDWGDPLDFTPDFAWIVGTKIPLVPLRLQSELDLGLGWLDRVGLISDAVMRGQHRH